MTTQTTADRTPFPERMRTMSATTHTACAAKALDDLADQAHVIKHWLEDGHGFNTASLSGLAGLVVTAAIHLSALEELRETREWDEAERNGEQS